ncbi:MAG TPA: hypothetical protein VNO21_11450, partial [Polyangiaceae bacterium]|nr:hypothetical protein [Polyangiaceae bacterium]
MTYLLAPSRRQALAMIAASLAASCSPAPASAQSPQPATPSEHKAVRPVVVAFDVFETVVSLEPVRARLQEIGLAPESLPLIFARMLRDGFALEAMGRFVPFRELAAATLRVELLDHDLPADDTKISHVLGAFATLPLHPDSR